MATTTQDFETGCDFAPDQAAQALLNLRCAVDHCHDAVFIADATGKIEFVNEAFEALTGYSEEEARQEGLPVFLESTSPTNACENLLEEVLEKGSIVERHLRSAKTDGEFFSIWR
jgi:PAS domain S-box-containing protein